MAPTPGRRGGDGSYRPAIAAFLSAVLPGAGQVYAGRRRRGAWYLAAALAVGLPAIVLTWLVVYGGRLDLAISLSRPFFEHPGLLLVLLALNGVLLLFRVFAVVDAFLLALADAPPRRSGRTVAPAAVAAGVVILAAVVVPHGYVAERNLAIYDAFTYDYTADPGQETTTTAASTTTAPAPPTSAGASTTSSSTTTSTSTTTTTTMPDPFEGYERVNVLLMGGDAGVGRRGIRTDTMIVVSIDPTTGWTAMFSVTRNTVQIPIPEGIPAYDAFSCHCYPGLANEIYQYGLANPGGFPGGPNTGGNAAKAVLGNLLGMDLHYFALVDLQGFVDVVDAVGGVTITVTDRVYDANYPHEDGTREVIDIQPGTYDMDGHLALAYARSRRTSDDYDRMGRQRCVIEALAEQADPVGLFHDLPDLVPALEGSVVTDIPVQAIPDFLDLLSRADLETIPSVRFMWRAPEFDGTPTSYVAGWTSDRYPIPNVPLIRETVQTVLSLHPADAISVLNLQPIEDAC
ncbi:MAG: LCP family protein [Actinobacteria bacterium]|nr:LCP family protein [Actinomycetota bacterium]